MDGSHPAPRARRIREKRKPARQGQIAAERVMPCAGTTDVECIVRSTRDCRSAVLTPRGHNSSPSEPVEDLRDDASFWHFRRPIRRDCAALVNTTSVPAVPLPSSGRMHLARPHGRDAR